MRVFRILLLACLVGLVGLLGSMPGTPDTAQAKVWKTSSIIFKATMSGIARKAFYDCLKTKSKSKKYAKGDRLHNFYVYVHQGGNPRGRMLTRKHGKYYVKYKLKTGQMYYVRVEQRIPCGVMSGGVSFRVNNWHRQDVNVPVVNYYRR